MLAYGVVLVWLCSACAGPRVAELEREVQATSAELERAEGRLAAADGGSATAAELRAEVERLRAQLLDLAARRPEALTGDTRDAGADLIWEAAAVLLTGGAGLVGLNARRNATRRAELAELNARLDDLEKGAA